MSRKKQHPIKALVNFRKLTPEVVLHIAGWPSTRMASTYVHPSRRRLSRAIEKLDQAAAGD